MISNRTLELIAKEQEAFREVLKVYLPNDVYMPHRILDICCGIANEEPLLRNHFGKNVELIGLDSNPDRKALSVELGRTSVITGNLREMDSYIKGKFGLVLGRNVPIYSKNHSLYKTSKDYWPKVFGDLTGFMEPKSTLFLTFLWGEEFNRADELLGELGYRKKVAELNPIKVPSDGIGVRIETKDPYIIMAYPPSYIG